jgi:hypothetical protein
MRSDVLRDMVILPGLCLKDHRALDSSCQLDTRPKPAKIRLQQRRSQMAWMRNDGWRLAIPLGRRYF